MPRDFERVRLVGRDVHAEVLRRAITGVIARFRQIHADLPSSATSVGLSTSAVYGQTTSDADDAEAPNAVAGASAQANSVAASSDGARERIMKTPSPSDDECPHQTL